MLFAFIYFFLNSYAYWTQVGETISQTTDSYVNQPGWIVSSSGSLNSFIFQKNCSKSITLEKGSYQSTKRIQLTEDSSLLHFSFNEIEVYCKLIANSEYFPNVFILSFIGTRSYPADGYETEIEIYDKSFTIITETNSEHFLFKFKDNNNPYLLINASVTNTIIIDISGFDLNGLETKYLFSFSRIAPTISLIYRNGKLVTDYNARYYSAFNRYFLKKLH